MDFSYSEEQESIRELAAQIFGEMATPERLLELANEPEGMDRTLWNQLGEANLAGVTVTEDYGGAGFGIEELCIVLEEQGRRVVPVPLLPHALFGALAIERFGSDEQKQRYLPGIATGDSIFTGALYEAASADPTRPRVLAARDGAGWKLDGEKSCVPYANVAHRVLVPAATGDGTMGVFVVDPRGAGVELEHQDTTNHEPQFRLTLSQVPVSAADLLGSAQGGSEIVEWLVERALLGLCALQLGITEEGLRQTAEYTSTRHQFERPIGSFQGVSMRAADAYIDVQAMRSTLWQGAWRLAAQRPATREILAAKWWASIGGHRVVHTIMHLHGGTGADVEYPVHRYFLWAKQNEATLGGANQQLANLGALIAQGA